MPGVPSQNAEEVAEYCLVMTAGFSWGHCYQERVKWFHCNRCRSFGLLGWQASVRVILCHCVFYTMVGCRIKGNSQSKQGELNKREPKKRWLLLSKFKKDTTYAHADFYFLLQSNMFSSLMRKKLAFVEQLMCARHQCNSGRDLKQYFSPKRNYCFRKLLLILTKYMYIHLCKYVIERCGDSALG